MPAAGPAPLTDKAIIPVKADRKANPPTPITDALTHGLRQEEPRTLAKMAMAAVAPKLIEGAIRFAIRNPVIAMVGAVTITGMLLHQQRARPAQP